MRARPVLWFVVAAALASPAAIGLHGAQDPQQPTFRTEANYVRVDVYPSSNGAPVTDLQKDDFEILEDGAPQTLDAFEHVLVAGNVPQEDRREPASLRESRAMLENPRARVFVIFLDYYHVDVGGSHAMRDTLVNALDRLLGAEDLFAVMTPEMSARDLSFARKTTTTRGMLEKYWTWGERDQLVSRDPEDTQYRACFASAPEIAEEMIERRREKLVLDAIQDVVRSLRGAREERKAVLAISNGWRLFRPDDRLQREVGGPPRLPPAGIDPRTGRITTDDKNLPPGSANSALCDRDRMALARIDSPQQLRDITDEANRANATFYPLDPRGLTAFDEPIMKLGTSGPPPPPLPPSVDRARLTARLESLRTLAADTDGMAIVQTNDLESGFKRILADLSSYYLLGYYSDRRMDGRFHSIRVRVKRPGVQGTRPPRLPGAEPGGSRRGSRPHQESCHVSARSRVSRIEGCRGGSRSAQLAGARAVGVSAGGLRMAAWRNGGCVGGRRSERGVGVESRRRCRSDADRQGGRNAGRAESRGAGWSAPLLGGVGAPSRS